MLDKVHASIDLNFQQHLGKTREFLQLPSISGTQPGIVDTAYWLRDQLKTLGGEVKLEGKPDAPIILAQFKANRPKTLLVYGMYDVQPVEGQEWSSPPFAADIRPLPGIGPAIIARGACNSKGPLMGFLNAVQAFKQVDDIPVNLILTIEGEEEIGSPSLPEFYRQNSEWLKNEADAGFEPFWAEYGTDVDQPIIALGSKGIVSIELVSRGGAWGGPISHSVHSSVGAWLASPAWRLLKAASILMDKNEKILIDDFSDEVIPPSPVEEKLLLALRKSFDEKKTLGMMGAKRFKFKEHGIGLLRRYLFTPSIQVGPLSHNSADTIDAEARLQLTIRLVPSMDPLETVNKIRRHLDRSGFEDIEVIILAHYPCSKTGFKEKVVQCMLETYRELGVEPQVWPMLASATPYYLFSDTLGLPYIWGGLGKAGGSHVADEYATVEGMKLFEKSIATFLFKFAQS